MLLVFKWSIFRPPLYAQFSAHFNHIFFAEKTCRCQQGREQSWEKVSVPARRLPAIKKCSKKTFPKSFAKKFRRSPGNRERSETFATCWQRGCGRQVGAGMFLLLCHRYLMSASGYWSVCRVLCILNGFWLLCAPEKVYYLNCSFTNGFLIVVINMGSCLVD